MKITTHPIVFACALMLMGFTGARAGIQPVELKCEYAPDPLGVDAPQPRLSWKLDSDQRAQRQSAYQILVASSTTILDRNQGDLWDSGRVQSDETLNVS